MGRATQGVRLINIKGNDSIAAVCKVMKEEDEEDQDQEFVEIDGTVLDVVEDLDEQVEDDQLDEEDQDQE